MFLGGVTNGTVVLLSIDILNGTLDSAFKIK